MFRKSRKSYRGRTMEQIRHHYEIEKEIADRLRCSTRQERVQIMRNMYDELFAKVPDHPRLTSRKDPKRDHIFVAHQMNLFKSFLKPDQTFLEFGPGNCSLAMALCSQMSRVYAVDISEQINPSIHKPGNFNFIVYDGYNLDLPNASIDIIFSNQMIEHMHPDDISDHFLLAYRLLKPGGIYAFCTPNRLYGPGDVSRFFSDVPQGFHLREWTFEELANLVKDSGFSKWCGYWYARGICFRIPPKATLFLEKLISYLPVKSRRRYGRYLLPRVAMVIQK